MKGHPQLDAQLAEANSFFGYWVNTVEHPNWFSSNEGHEAEMVWRRQHFSKQLLQLKNAVTSETLK